MTRGGRGSSSHTQIISPEELRASFFLGSGRNRQFRRHLFSGEPPSDSPLHEYHLSSLYLPVSLTCALVISRGPSTVNHLAPPQVAAAGPTPATPSPSDHPFVLLEPRVCPCSLYFSSNFTRAPPPHSTPPAGRRSTSPRRHRAAPAAPPPPLASLCSGQSILAVVVASALLPPPATCAAPSHGRAALLEPPLFPLELPVADSGAHSLTQAICC